ncbi:hypothetical protein [Nocardia sp. AG03]|uniref:hypothetical protein n=1 Tax=Nocardia sp. AG03 TaxID=3025312 RepID=UPI0024189C6E|nr:hypothetical protein [Nocardia sp. AG03]
MNDQGRGLESAPPQTDPFTEPAPAIPGIDAPDASVTPTPGTAAQLARYTALRAAPRHVAIILAIAVSTSTIVLLWLGLSGEQILVIQAVVAVYVLVATYFSLRRQYRAVSRSDVTGGSCALALGADALDLADGASRTRIGYDRIGSVRATRRVVDLGFDNRHVALPRALFADDPLAELRRLVDPGAAPRPAPLPPMPRLPRPQAQLVIAADTAHRLTVARRLEPYRRTPGRLAIVLVLLEVCAFGGLEYGVPGALSALVGAVLWVLAVRFWMRRPSANAVRQYQGMLPASSGLAAQFGTDAMVLAGATFLLRVPYSNVAEVTLRADCAVVKYGAAPLVLPRGLFPPEVLPRLQEVGVVIVDR